jgi:sugar lactone lactonase YvrE
MRNSRVPIIPLAFAAAGLALAAAPRAGAQDVYVSDFDKSQILDYTQSGTLARTFSSGGLFVNPDGLAFSGGSLYVSAQSSSTGDGSIYQYDLSNPSAAPTLFAADPGGVLSGLAFGGGNLYAADSSKGRILAFDAQTGTQITSFGGGSLTSPIGLAFQGGSLYVADSSANDVVKYSDSGVSQGTFITAGSGGLQMPGELAFDSAGNLLVASGQGASNGGAVDRFDSAGNPNPSSGKSGAVFASDPGLFNPYGLAISPTGAVFVGDRNSNQLNGSGGGGHFDQLDSSGALVQSVPFNGGNGNPYGLALGPAAPAAAPEPSGAVSLAVSAAGLALLGLRLGLRRRSRVQPSSLKDVSS